MSRPNSINFKHPQFIFTGYHVLCAVESNYIKQGIQKVNDESQDFSYERKAIIFVGDVFTALLDQYPDARSTETTILFSKLQRFFQEHSEYAVSKAYKHIHRIAFRKALNVICKARNQYHAQHQAKDRDDQPLDEVQKKVADFVDKWLDLLDENNEVKVEKNKIDNRRGSTRTKQRPVRAKGKVEKSFTRIKLHERLIATRSDGLVPLLLPKELDSYIFTERKLASHYLKKKEIIAGEKQTDNFAPGSQQATDYHRCKGKVIAKEAAKAYFDAEDDAWKDLDFKTDCAIREDMFRNRLIPAAERWKVAAGHASESRLGFMTKYPGYFTAESEKNHILQVEANLSSCKNAFEAIAKIEAKFEKIKRDLQQREAGLRAREEGAIDPGKSDARAARRAAKKGAKGK
ncbi:hypothetical protein QBC35DRAFT_551055 [Podospora australis]|uniref:Uncharacterized protein n=1 Tax=Podospora australis TaxID=1536484 RepID=A0AAN7AGI9_9PEZI|nr:hypothetical protein QBC35DRAFT_551055 [Podospora australis]